MYENWLSAKNVVVIGAGTMGSGIAAHLANIGFNVTLLDVTRESAREAFERAKQARPPHFFVQERANSVVLGGIDEDFGLVATADWVCEAVVENLDVKRNLFAKLDEFLRPDAMVSTNTSGLQISLLAEGRSESFRKRFLGTHFFNPPRYLKLLELIPTGDTDPEAIKAFTQFLEEKVARRVVLAKDTPGFIANRYGMWAMYHAIHTAERLHLTVEQVDAITGPFLGRPRSASFRLNDLVGLDIMRDIANNLIERCPNDAHIGNYQPPASLLALIGRNWIGDKTGQGYYRKEGKELLALDLQTFAYRQKQEVSFPSIDALGALPLGERISKALDQRDELGEFLRNHLVPVLQYANYLRDEVSHSVLDFDRVMMWGFGWQMGPFAMIDAIGAEKLGIHTGAFYKGAQMLGTGGGFVDIKPEPYYRTLQEAPVIGGTDTYNLRDLGDGVTAVALRTKMGAITPQLVDDLTALLEGGKVDKIVLTSEARAFSVGYDLTFFDAAIGNGMMSDIDQGLQRLQRLGELLEEHDVVAAVHGYTLGAGLELALGCRCIVADSEAKIGLPEVKVGLLPGGRGTALVRLNNQHNIKRLTETALVLIEGAVSTNADEARMMGYLRGTDITSYHPDRLLHEAKLAALGSVRPTRPAWTTPEGPITGMIDRGEDALVARGVLTDYDRIVGSKIKFIFAKAISYDAALELERKEFVDLCGRSLTHARIKHMLDIGRPLRN